MKQNMLHGPSLAALLTVALTVSGCGGGGGTSNTMAPADPTTPTPTLAVPTGMSASTESGVQAQNANHTIANLLPRPESRFAPVSARSRTDEFHVTSISSDGDNGFHVTFVLGGVESTVHFEDGDFGASPSFATDYFVETPDGARFWLNGIFRAFSEEDRTQGPPGFEYLVNLGAGGRRGDVGNRQHLAFGARTEPANLPTATAIYSGRMFAENHPVEYENLDTRGEMWGRWRLTADFGESSLRGDIRLLTARATSDSRSRSLPYTTYFSIENGQIVDGQFTASVSGEDSNPNASMDETVKGFEGDVLGEFFGPAAEEAGGVLRATRAADNRVLIGSLEGKQMPELDPSLPEGTLSVLSVAVDRDYVADTVQRTGAAEVTAIESDGASGFYVTYRVDGTDHRVHIAEQIYLNRWTEAALFSYGPAGYYSLHDQTGSVGGTPEFQYFDIHGWSSSRIAADGDVESVLRGFVVSGVPTETTDLPAGTATYEGRAHFLSWPSDNPNLSAHVRGDSRLSLNAHFGAGTVDGTIDQIGDLLGPISEVAIANGTIQNGELTADLRGGQPSATFEGDMSGRFYGPGAPELAGVLEGEYHEGQDSNVVLGWFGGKMN